MIDLRGFRGWAEIVDQPFLRLLRQGRVSNRAFQHWLTQERYLYEGMLGFQTALLRRARPQHRLIVAQALVITVEELDWMDSLNLPARPIHPMRLEYLDFLETLEHQSYEIGTLAHWVRQKAFFDAWQAAGSLEELPGEFSEHWLAPEAQALTHDLGSLALEVTDTLPHHELDEWVAQVLAQEQTSWEMALEFTCSNESS
ncbi:MAG: hypothetical protein IVW51_10025 [Thermaceae bacterium]|nr:hypothetical protein [Thermaceae bacterium]